MARSVDKPEKLRAPPPEDWRKFLPPPARRGRGPYDPVPIIPDDPDSTIPASIEVDPPSRPHLITRAPPYGPSFDLPSTQFVSPDSSMSEFMRRSSGGLLGMMERVGVIDPSAPDVPPGGGPVALLQEYLRSNREPTD